MTKLAAQKLFAKTGFKPSDVQVVELHDCFSANELITYEALGLCPEGKAGEMIDRGDNTYGGKYVVNPSGGLISKGHPLGATGKYNWAYPAFLCWLALVVVLEPLPLCTSLSCLHLVWYYWQTWLITFTIVTRSGLAQCAELTWQLRGEADKRQVSNCKLALQHNIGLGGAVVVALYKMAVEKQVSCGIIFYSQKLFLHIVYWN